VPSGGGIFLWETPDFEARSDDAQKIRILSSLTQLQL
jgi:hypothetical protein